MKSIDLDELAKKVLCARVYDVARETDLDPMPGLSERCGNEVLLKREDLQPVFSFKLRGAYNKMVQLSAKDRAAGVVASSAGNHAQGVALAAKRLGIKAMIVMPRTTPQIKVDSVLARDAQVVLEGENYDAAYEHARRLADQQGMAFVHPYDDVEVIAGQGSIGMELLRQTGGQLDAVFLPVGGGGLASGVGALIKYLRPEIKLIAVEPDDAACFYEAWRAGRRVTLPQVGIFADGVAVRTVGELPFEVLSQLVDDVVLVSGDEICAAIKDTFDDTRAIVEPAGALSLAGLKKYVEQLGWQGRRLAAIASGANMNFNRLSYVAERVEIGARREALLAVTIEERPGSFKRFCDAIGKRPVSEFNYRYSDAQCAHVFAGVQLSAGDSEREAIVSQLRGMDYSVEDLTENEMAKEHVRFMVGGRAPAVLENERLFRFEFPERPGALLEFLTQMAAGWNISLFHYRNQGGDFGRVLAGIQVPSGDSERFDAFLDGLGYVVVEESSNPAYRLFL